MKRLILGYDRDTHWGGALRADGKSFVVLNPDQVREDFNFDKQDPRLLKRMTEIAAHEITHRLGAKHIDEPDYKGDKKGEVGNQQVILSQENYDRTNMAANEVFIGDNGKVLGPIDIAWYQRTFGPPVESVPPSVAPHEVKAPKPVHAPHHPPAKNER